MALPSMEWERLATGRGSPGSEAFPRSSPVCLDTLKVLNGTVKLTEPSRDSPQNDKSPQSLNRRTSPLSNRKKPGPGFESMMSGLEMMTTDSEQVLDRTVN